MWPGKKGEKWGENGKPVVCRRKENDFVVSSASKGKHATEPQRRKRGALFFGLGRALGDGKVFPFVFHWRLRHFFPPNSDHFAGVSHFTVAKISSRESDAGFLSQFQESIQGLSWIRPFSYMKHYAVKICYSLVAFRFS